MRHLGVADPAEHEAGRADTIEVRGGSVEMIEQLPKLRVAKKPRSSQIEPKQDRAQTAGVGMGSSMQNEPKRYRRRCAT
jgi:hypothetical protein